MTGSSSVVLSNLAYLIGAVVLAVIGGFAVWLHHRQPRSIDANVDAFQRGLQALAPDSSRPGPVRPPPPVPVERLRVRPRSAVTLQTPQPAPAPPGAPPAGEQADSRPGTATVGAELVPAEAARQKTPPQPATGDGAGERAGADTG